MVVLAVIHMHCIRLKSKDKNIKSMKHKEMFADSIGNHEGAI